MRSGMGDGLGKNRGGRSRLPEEVLGVSCLPIPRDGKGRNKQSWKRWSRACTVGCVSFLQCAVYGRLLSLIMIVTTKTTQRVSAIEVHRSMYQAHCEDRR